MTGPAYPLPPAPESNAIGSGAVGVAQVGDIPPFVWWDTVISQYANSPILVQLLTNVAAYLDQTANFDEFFDLIMNVDTAQGYGLDVWGRRVGIGRVITIYNWKFFGFAESGTAVGFGQGPFFAGSPLTSNYTLDDAVFRLLILAKAAANITNCSIGAINAILLSLFPDRGDCYVVDNVTSSYFGFAESGTAVGFGQGRFANPNAGPGMAILYKFEFPLSPIDFGLLNSGVVPTPTGVFATIQSA